jgi:uncharacterized membrane protein YeaQ/YmgE (transglycosylase-associated protein family)
MTPFSNVVGRLIWESCHGSCLLIVGVLAKWIMPGGDPGGIIVTIVLGIVGSVMGGMIGAAIGFGGVSGFDIRSLLVATGGALLLLTAYRLVTHKVAA